MQRIDEVELRRSRATPPANLRRRAVYYEQSFGPI